MAEYIECRHCESPNCKGCNVYSLAIMLYTGKFDCLMNGNRTVNRFADVAPVVHGRWSHLGGDEWCCTNCGEVIHTEGSWEKPDKKFCNDCGAKMDLEGGNT